MMRLSRYAGNPNIGVFAAVNESLALVACDSAPEFIQDLEQALGVKTFMTTVAGSFVVGSLVAMNSFGAVVSELSEQKELDEIRKLLPIATLTDRTNAAGNNVLVNDRGALINPEVGAKAMKEIADVLNVEVVKGTIAGCTTVGSVCSVTNKGCVCTVDATDDDVKLLESIFKVEVKKTTVNHGCRYVGSGILSNSKGALIGDETTPIEMGKIEDGLVLY